jgi:hypothetical protein
VNLSPLPSNRKHVAVFPGSIQPYVSTGLVETLADRTYPCDGEATWGVGVKTEARHQDRASGAATTALRFQSETGVDHER